MSDITTHHRWVADYDGTSFQQQFEELSGDCPVVLAHDAETGLCCALAQAPGQSAADHEREARFQLARHIHREQSS